MNVMVTGATVPLGVAIIERLLADPTTGHVLAVGREPREPWPDSRVTYRMANLTRTREVHDLIHGDARAHAIDTVIHAAQHRGANDSGHYIHAQNVESARALVHACTDHPTIRRLVARSFAEVYEQPQATTSLIDEEDALDFDPSAPQWLRDRVEADLTIAAHGGSLQTAVLRCAELIAPDSGSQLWDYLSSRVCLRPAGFDPIINVLSLEDASTAFVLAARSATIGVFNIVGADTLPLSRAIFESNRLDIPVPGLLMAPLYRLRHALAGFEFRYDLNVRRFHFGGVLDGTRARRELGYVPQAHVHWPRPWLRVLFERLSEARST
jgi:UDP-glucose 4-epimerase